MDGLSIGQVARQAGLRPSAIRYYESIAVLPSPRRVDGQRRYDRTVLDRLAFIQIAQRLGFTLTEIQLLFHNREEDAPLSERWRGLANRKLAEVETLNRSGVGGPANAHPGLALRLHRSPRLHRLCHRELRQPAGADRAGPPC